MLQVNEQRTADTTILALTGRLDSGTAADLTARLRALVAAGQRLLLLDLSQLAYLSSAGFRALLIGAKLAGEAGGSLAVCALSPSVRRLFEVAAFDQVFDIFASQQDALASRAGE